MLRTILIWLGVIPDPRPMQLSLEGQATIDRLNEMRDDIYRLTHEQWLSKWLRGE